LSNFLSAIKRAWKFADPSRAPSELGLDRFLMMRGKALMSHKAPPLKITGTEPPVAAPANRSTGSRASVGGGSISLPYGGPGATFQVSTLIQHLEESRRRYIIQGQTECRFNTHRKPQSLDFWSRRNFAKNPGTKQAVNDVIHKLVSTGFFEAGEFPYQTAGTCAKASG
jgi:hypothetical protein